MDATQSPMQEHLEFDRMCSTLEEFEHLPSISATTREPGESEHEGEQSEHGEERELDQLILAGLVSPM